MKTFVRFAVAVLVLTAVCQVSLAGENYWVSGDGSANLTGQKAAGQAPCNSCNEAACCPEQCGSCATCGSDPCCCCEMGCDECPPWAIVGLFGVDAFKGISDYNGPSNFGVVTGLNIGVPIPGLRDYGFGWQIGLTYGAYDLDGRAPEANLVGIQSTAHTQQQTFVTTGFFRKAQCGQRLSFGMVYDWMYNCEWGVFGNNPTLGQWRGQVEYAMNACNGVGVWAAQRDRSSIQEMGRYTVSDRALSQVNMFWHHKFCSGADSWVWMGLPDHGRYSGDKSFADWMVGFNVQVPLSDRLALYGNASYLHPSAAAGADAAIEQGWDAGMGLVWYVGGYARSNAINGKCWTPYLQVANNSTFLVEQGFTAATP